MSEKFVSCGLTIDEIKELANCVSDNKLGKIKIKNGDCEIIIEGEKVLPPTPAVMTQPAAPSMVNVTTTTASAPNAEINTSTEKQTKGNVVKSPIVGTFYAAPAPGKPAFVKIGDTVKKGDVIMIIESMKLMNEVQSDFDGKVTEILVEDGQAVEFDQPIMIIE
ncbi:MAG: acetyl-CoA carboxylase biotin carboxyl carrier protein [Ruminococcus sp.]|nr:acetyl-CoA carboxylase biotin carboxyl carrier protein [Ruminococcus sp.]